MATVSDSQPTRRALAMLRAVAAGCAEIMVSCEPDLRIDGLACCDQHSAHELTHAGLLTATRAGRIGSWVPAALTREGWELISAPPD